MERCSENKQPTAKCNLPAVEFADRPPLPMSDSALCGSMHGNRGHEFLGAVSADELGLQHLTRLRGALVSAVKSQDRGGEKFWCTDLFEPSSYYSASDAAHCEGHYLDPADYPEARTDFAGVGLEAVGYPADCSSGCMKCEYGRVPWHNHTSWGCMAGGWIYSHCPPPSSPPSPPIAPPPSPPAPASPPYNLPPSAPPSPPQFVDTTGIGGVGLALSSLIFAWTAYEILMRAILWPCCLDGYLPTLHPDSSLLRLVFLACAALSCGLQIPRYAVLATIEVYTGGVTLLDDLDPPWLPGRHCWSYLMQICSALAFFLALVLLLYAVSDELSGGNSRLAVLMRRRSLMLIAGAFSLLSAVMGLAWLTSGALLASAFVEPYGAAFSWIEAPSAARRASPLRPCPYAFTRLCGDPLRCLSTLPWTRSLSSAQFEHRGATCGRSRPQRPAGQHAWVGSRRRSSCVCSAPSCGSSCLPRALPLSTRFARMSDVPSCSRSYGLL